MKRLLTILAFALTFMPLRLGAVTSTRLSPSQALEQAFGYSRATDYTLDATIFDSSAMPAIYQFNEVSGESTYFISAKETLSPIIGWTDHALHSSEQMPPAMKQWLEEMANSKTEAMFSRASSSNQRQPISPLLKTEWNQTKPYNQYCPIISGTRAPVGCVATAMAMIVHHNSVFNGDGSTTIYDSTGNNLTVNLEDFHPDFKSMPLTSSDNSNWDDVARLSAICGDLVSMKYGLSGSGAYSYNVPDALARIGYDPQKTFLLYRKSYSIEQWNNMLYTELSANRPVFYAGGAESPHAFVCDGYAPGNYFHINWGWGGAGNGYFALSSLIPDISGTGASVSNNYTSAQECVLCRPYQAENALLYLKISGYCTTFPSDPSRMRLMFNVVGPSGDFPVNAGYIIENESNPGVPVKTEETGIVECHSSASLFSGITLNNSDVAKGLLSGRYVVYPAFIPENETMLVKASELKTDYALSLVIDESGLISTSAISSDAILTSQEFKIHGPVYKTTNPSFSFRIINSGHKDAFTSVTATVTNIETGETVRTKTVDNVEVEADASAMFNVTLPNYSSGFLPAGQYSFQILDAASNNISSSSLTFDVLAQADPSSALASNDPYITIEHAADEPELILPPAKWNHNVLLTCKSARSATLGLAFYPPGEYTQSAHYKLPYQRYETSNRMFFDFNLDEINPEPGTYEIAYAQGGLEISTRKWVEVAWLCEGIYYLINHQTKQAAVAALKPGANGHITIPQEITYNNVSYTVSSVRANAFANCPDLVSIDLPATITSIDGDLFVNSEPAAIIFHPVQMPFEYHQSVFNTLSNIPDIYVPLENHSHYFEKLDNITSVYSLIESVETPNDASVYVGQSQKFALPITPSSETINNSFIATATDNSLLTTHISDIDKDAITIECSGLHKGVTNISVNSPQPGFKPIAFPVEIHELSNAIDCTDRDGELSINILSLTEIEIRNALPGTSVLVFDINGRIIASGKTGLSESTIIKLHSPHKQIIVKIGEQATKIGL